MASLLYGRKLCAIEPYRQLILVRFLTKEKKINMREKKKTEAGTASEFYKKKIQKIKKAQVLKPFVKKGLA